YQRTEWAQAGLFGKPDVVPSSIKHLRDLRNLQMTVYAEIVRGERTLDYFDDFVAEWTERGGAEMTQEAREIYKVREEIYRKVGVRRSAGRGIWSGPASDPLAGLWRARCGCVVGYAVGEAALPDEKYGLRRPKK
ncbi:MAG: hypothetical protein OXE49_08990, partial [Gemmatimonadetes bacterium]|nr:hypothetical protein [Gemmatimonadota bacterium]